jgi:hypothetical protein
MTNEPEMNQDTILEELKSLKLRADYWEKKAAKDYSAHINSNHQEGLSKQALSGALSWTPREVEKLFFAWVKSMNNAK